jgi:hypothetical protein
VKCLSLLLQIFGAHFGELSLDIFLEKDDILAVGEKFGIKKAEGILADMKDIIGNFRYYANKHKYPKDKAVAIEGVLKCW